MEAGTIDVYIGLSLIILSIICGVVLGYYWTRCFHLRKEMVMVKRHELMVLISIPLAMVLLFFGIPLSIYTILELSIVPIKDSQRLMIQIICHMLWIPPALAYSLLTLSRLWLLVFDIRSSISVSNVEWKKLVTKNMKTLRKEEWYIKHRPSLGNMTYLLKRAICTAIMVSILGITLKVLYMLEIMRFKAYIFVTLMYFICFTIAIVAMYWKIPHFHDTFHIHRELQLLTYTAFIGLIAYADNETVNILIGTKPYDQIINCAIHIYAAFFISFIQSYWVLRQFRVQEALTPISIPPVSLRLQVPGGSNSRHSLSIVKRRDSFKVPDDVRAILKDESFLNRFADHLITEYSTECLLSLIEFQQFKQRVIDKLKVKETSGKDVWVEFSGTIPQSDIVNGQQKTCTTTAVVPVDTVVRVDTPPESTVWMQKACALYEKYVKVGSEFEINIPSKMRLALQESMSDEERYNMSAVELAMVFDGAMVEMLRLLQYSVVRFRDKELFRSNDNLGK